MAVLSDPLKSFKNNDLIKALRELCRQTCSKKRSTRVNHTCTLPLPPSPPSLFHTKNDPKTHTTHFPPKKTEPCKKAGTLYPIGWSAPATAASTMEKRRTMVVVLRGGDHKKKVAGKRKRLLFWGEKACIRELFFAFCSSKA